MSFLGRFIKVPIRVYNSSDLEMGLNTAGRDTWYAFVPFDLSSYRPAYGQEEPDRLATNILLKNGDEVLVDLLPEEFEARLKAWDV